jgi:hypothetical protein
VADAAGHEFKIFRIIVLNPDIPYLRFNHRGLKYIPRVLKSTEQFVEPWIFLIGERTLVQRKNQRGA